MNQLPVINLIYELCDSHTLNPHITVSLAKRTILFPQNFHAIRYTFNFIHFFPHLKLTQMLLEVVWNTQLKFR